MSALAIFETSDSAAAAEEHARSLLHPAIFAHSVRVFVLAIAGTPDEDPPYAFVEELAVAALFHDIGTASRYDGPQRFEVESADAASRFLRARSWSQARVQPVWEAIALHTSPGLAERFGPTSSALRAGVSADFDRSSPRMTMSTALEASWPRGDIERVLADAVVQQAIRSPGKAPSGSWPGALVDSYQRDPDAGGMSGF
jgi:hypothetical protein